MRGNVPIPELPDDEDVWLIVVVSSVRQRRTQQGESFAEAVGRNVSGSIDLKILSETLRAGLEFKAGLWSVTGRLDRSQNRTQLLVNDYRPVTIAQYREQHQVEPRLPRAFTLDIETLALPDFRERVGSLLERLFRLGNMRLDQQQRYLEDIAAEEERSYQLGALRATTGRVLSIAVHLGWIPGMELGEQSLGTEYVFGIDKEGNEEPEARTLQSLLNLFCDFDPETDEIVGHNILSFDLPFIFQRCLINNMPARPFVNLSEYNPRGVYDTMRQWWFGDRSSRVSLDDIAWALGIESSKTSEVEGSKVFDLYQAGRLADIREYNLNDVRVTRKVYERMVTSFGR
jgi:Predicted 3'-5' exonuclease related to the exonuclease domain of PolB